MSVNNKVTVGTFRKRKAAGEKISMLTVYDAPARPSVTPPGSMRCWSATLWP